MIEPGALVLVLSCGVFHVAARVEGRATAPGVWWLDVNTMGSHLPQMYREDEIEEIGAPSSVLPHGLCPSCRGYGIVTKFVPDEHDGPCSSCGGSGRIGVSVNIVRDDDSTTEVSIDIDPSARTGIACELCAAATVPYPRS